MKYISYAEMTVEEYLEQMFLPVMFLVLMLAMTRLWIEQEIRYLTPKPLMHRMDVLCMLKLNKEDDMQSRIQLLNALIGYDAAPEHIISSLRQFSWDSDVALVTLHHRHVTNILERYLRKELVGSDVEAWANAIEGREDIAYEARREEDIQEAIHVLANPLLTEPLNAPNARRLLKALQ